MAIGELGAHVTCFVVIQPAICCGWISAGYFSLYSVLCDPLVKVLCKVLVARQQETVHWCTRRGKPPRTRLEVRRAFEVSNPHKKANSLLTALNRNRYVREHIAGRRVWAAVGVARPDALDLGGYASSFCDRYGPVLLLRWLTNRTRAKSLGDDSRIPRRSPNGIAVYRRDIRVLAVLERRVKKVEGSCHAFPQKLSLRCNTQA